jgi:hypothetical protein
MESLSPDFETGDPNDKAPSADKGLKEPKKVSIAQGGLGFTRALASLRKRMKSLPPPPPILRPFFNPLNPGVPGGFD